MIPGSGTKAPAVLIVEDEPLVRLCAAQTVEDAGYEVIEAESADEAIAILESRRDIACDLHRHSHARFDGRPQTRACGAPSLAPDQDHRDLGARNDQAARSARRRPFLCQTLRSGRDKRHIAGVGALKPPIRPAFTPTAAPCFALNSSAMVQGCATVVVRCAIGGAEASVAPNASGAQCCCLGKRS